MSDYAERDLSRAGVRGLERKGVEHTKQGARDGWRYGGARQAMEDRGGDTGGWL